MTLIFTTAIILAAFAMMVFLVIRNVRQKASINSLNGAFAVLYVSLLCLLVLGSIMNENSCVRVFFDMCFVFLPMSILMSSVFTDREKKKCFNVFVSLQMSVAAYYILCLSGVAPVPSESAHMTCIMLLSLVYVFLFCWKMCSRMNNVSVVIKSGTVYAHMMLVLDTVYLVAFLMQCIVIISVGSWDSPMAEVIQGVTAGLLCASMLALTSRAVMDMAFVFLTDQECRIFESMKVSHVEVSNRMKPDMYKELYDRVVVYFESEMPFLNNSLTINDVAKVVFSNKLYISRAISQQTGRNFCQFVNYYRVSYSIEAFRNNPDLKINEMSEISGFNTTVSFNMAFRLFMSENPSDWCRKERLKLMKKKK